MSVLRRKNKMANPPYDVIIPSDLDKNGNSWKRTDVLTFLSANKEGYDLDNDDIEVKLTEEKGKKCLTHNVTLLLSECIVSANSVADIKCNFTFKHGRDTKITKYTRAKVEFSAAFFQNETLNSASDLTLEVQDDKNQLYKFDQHSLEDEAASGSIIIVISTNQRPFSSWTFSELKAQFVLFAESYTELQKFHLPKVLSNHNKVPQLTNNIAREVEKALLICPTATTGNGSTRSLAVYEILKQDVDLSEYEGLLVMVVKAKKRDFDQGVAQFAIQLHSAIHLNRKRKGEDDHSKPEHLFGIVTIGDYWVLLRMEGNANSVHDEAPKRRELLQNQIRDLFGYIVAIYTDVEDWRKGRDVNRQRILGMRVKNTR
ncbi:hypothetical protein EV426DRAFT_706544 [Tirmania nivea]|nr:hypothetical protein EV426DRAFT_706544 [Tirmania nivea]